MCLSKFGKELLSSKGKLEQYDLNNIVQLFRKDEDQHATFSSSQYYEVDKLIDLLKDHKHNFTTLTLNIEELNTKYNELLAFVKLLDAENIHISAILLQETMLSDSDCEENNIKIFDIPNYNLIPMGRKCGRKGGLAIYLHNDYEAKRKNLYKQSEHWEGMFIDVTSDYLPKKIILGNVYRPPRDNYSDVSIDRFLEPMTQILKKIHKEKCAAQIGGDYNINLLRLNEREKFQQYFDYFVTQDLFPQITLPTRFSKNNATLIDQLFCRFSKYESHCASGIILRKISDHLPCFTSMNIHGLKEPIPKFVKIRDSGPQSLETFVTEVHKNMDDSLFDFGETTDPNVNYGTLENIIKTAREKSFP